MHAHIRVPPDSTGKRIHGRAFVDLTYSSLTGTITKGAAITFTASGVLGTITKWEEDTSTTGQMHIWVNADSAEVDVTVGESFTYTATGGSGGGVVDTANRFFDQAMIVTGKGIDSWMDVDEYGAVLTSYADGSPTLDAASKTRVSSAKPIGAYDFASGPQDSLFYDNIAGTGSVTYLPASSAMLLSVGTASGDIAARSTNRYHYYQVGTSMMNIITVTHGDAGKANNVRYWGVGDDNNCMSWTLEGTQVGVYLSSDVTGSVVETSIPQSQWNIDKLDGAGTSKFTLDITKRVMYWIDYMWPVGAIRFGIFAADGQRIVAHQHQSTGNGALPFTRIGHFPVLVKNENTGVAASTSELRYFSSSMYAEGNLDYVYWRYSDMENTALKTITTNTPVLSVRPVLIAEGVTNRVNAYPETINVFVTGGDIKLDLYVDIDPADLTGEVWNLTGSSTLEGDETASAISLTPYDGSKMVTYYLGAGSHTLDISKYFETNDIGFCLNGDGTTSYANCFVATKLEGTTVQARMTLSYRELS